MSYLRWHVQQILNALQENNYSTYCFLTAEQHKQQGLDHEDRDFHPLRLCAGVALERGLIEDDTADLIARAWLAGLDAADWLPALSEDDLRKQADDYARRALDEQ